MRARPATAASAPAGSPVGANPVPALGARTMLACFGMACPTRGLCARYAAVDQSGVDRDTLATCRSGTHFPLFMRLADPPLALAA